MITDSKVLQSKLIETPLGQMVAIGDDEHLYLLEFWDRLTLKRQIDTLKKTAKVKMVEGECKSISSIEKELELYFKGKLKDFKTPIKMFGTTFRVSVWKALREIPYGETRAYKDVAISINNPKCVRALAGACGANRLALIIPCHRVINANGKMGGYSGGLHHKPKLLKLEEVYENN